MMMMAVVENEIEVKAQRFIFDPFVRNTKYGGVFSIFFLLMATLATRGKEIQVRGRKGREGKGIW